MGYCKKHKQKYMDHIQICPICIGEKMIDYTHLEAPDVYKKALEILKNDEI